MPPNNPTNSFKKTKLSNLRGIQMEVNYSTVKLYNNVYHALVNIRKIHKEVEARSSWLTPQRFA